MRLVYIALGWATGIILAANITGLIPLFWLLALGLSVFATRLLWSSRWRWVAIVSVALAFGGYRYGFVPQSSAIAHYNDNGATIHGTIVDIPDIRDDRTQIKVATESVNVGDAIYATDGIVLVNAPRSSDLHYGDYVLATGTLRTPAEYDTFSYADYLARQGVFSLMDNATIEVIGSDDSFWRQMDIFKTDLQARIGAALPDPQAALLTGILLGNERGIDPQLADDFNRTGAAHIIAISGFNMAIISGVIMGLLQRIFPKRRRLGTVIGIGIIAIYTLLVGANAAVIRAAVMSSMLVIGNLLERKTYIPASLAATAIFMSFLDPLVLWDISFQLSFFAVLGLALFTNPLTRGFNVIMEYVLPQGLARMVASILNEPLIVTIAALSLTLPLTILYFQRLSLAALLVNLLIVPVQAWLLIIGGMALIASFIVPSIGQLLFWVDMVLLSWSIAVVRWFADIPSADISATLPPQFVGGLFIVVILGAIMTATRPRYLEWLYRRTAFFTIIFGGLAVGILLIGMVTSRPDGKLHVWWLDVGHTNAVLLQTPNGSQVLVDGGRYPSRLLTSVGDRLPFYDRELELVIVTQPDIFDMSAVPALLQRYRTQAILINGQANSNDAYLDLLENHNTVVVRAGYTVDFGDGTQIEVLHPSKTPQPEANLNDGTLVLRVTYGDVSFLLTGDLSRDAQEDLVTNGQWLGASVLSLPQHGTQRSLSNEFMDAVGAQVYVLQSDRANRRGDPDIDILSELGDTPLFRTDTQGALHLYTDGRTLWASGDN